MVDADDRARPSLLQGDIIAVDDEEVIIVGRSCDLPRATPTHVHVATVIERDHDDVGTPAHVDRGWDPRLLPIPAGSEDRFVDMRTARPIDKQLLPAHPLSRGCTTADEAQAFRRVVGRYFSMSSLPDGVQHTVNTLWDELRRRRGRGEHPSIWDRIEDIRATFDPDADPADEETEREMMLWFIIESGVGDLLPAQPVAAASDFGEATERFAGATTAAEQALAVAAYCSLLFSKCEPHEPVTKLGHMTVSSSDFSRDQMIKSYPIRVEAMSHTTGDQGHS